MDGLAAELRDRFGITAADGITLVTLDRLARLPFDPAMNLVILPPNDPAEAATRPTQPPEPPSPAVPAAPPYRPATLPGRHARGDDPVATLRTLYPANHSVLGLGDLPAATIGNVTAGQLRSGPHLVPALRDLDNIASPYGLPWLVARLRAPGGCPWDREQDHRTLRPFLLEEAYEVYDALDAGPTAALADELGDLWLQVVLHAQLAAEAGTFDLTDVQRSIMTKIVRRHPHVFGEVDARTADQVVRNWERIKADERAATGTDAPADATMPAAFAGLSNSLPALAYADEMQARAASLGYDWPDLEGVIDKVAEEASELLAATDAGHREEEYGDLLFVLVNLGRKLGIDPEASLRSASRKFAARFARVERIAGSRGVELRALGPDALDDLWHEAKREEMAEREQPAVSAGEP
jgi:MazG family protein